MTYETENNITFHVIREKLCKFEYSRTLPMNVAIESARCGCDKNSCKDWVWWKMCGEHG